MTWFGRFFILFHLTQLLQNIFRVIWPNFCGHTVKINMFCVRDRNTNPQKNCHNIFLRKCGKLYIVCLSQLLMFLMTVVQAIGNSE